MAKGTKRSVDMNVHSRCSHSSGSVGTAESSVLSWEDMRAAAPDPRHKHQDILRRRESSRAAKRAELNALRGSLVLKEEKVRGLPSFLFDEVILGTKLGTGGFNDVFEIRRIALFTEQAPWESKDVGGAPHSGGTCTREYLASTCLVKSKHETSGRYAIKCIRENIYQDEVKYLTAVRDIVTETHFLSVLDHPNIMKIRGLVLCESESAESSSSRSRRATGQDAGYLIIMDRLHGTLADKFEEWYDHSKSWWFLLNKKKASDLLYEKMKLAHTIAEVFLYIHDLNLLYRDIKPENIGFDMNGNVKVFDFGLCKELHAHKRDEHGLYRLSIAGAPRYMAPEIIRGERYNQSTDYYSYGVVLWEIFTMEKAFEGWSWDMLESQAHGDQVMGLKISKSLPPLIKTLIQDSCSTDWTARPTFTETTEELEHELHKSEAHSSEKSSYY